MSHEICWDRDGVVRRFWGHVPFAEVLQSVCEVEVDSRFEKARYLIDDCSGVFDGCLVHDSPLARLDLFQRLSSSISTGIFRAVVTDPVHVNTVKGELRDVLDNSRAVGIFTSTADARAWIAEVAVQN